MGVDLFDSGILSNVGMLCLACFIGLSVSTIIIVKPIIGTFMLSVLFPFGIIAINNIGYTYFMSAFRFVSFITFVMFICIFAVKHKK